MRHFLDLVAILLMGDGLAKLLSPVNHSRFYQAPWAPEPYNRFLQRQVESPSSAVFLGLGMIIGGAVISRWAEKAA